MTTKQPALVLASTSPYRAQLMNQLGLSYTQHRPEVDEESYRDLDPIPMARTLAEAKARALSHLGGLIIGSDQVLECEGEVFGKPGSQEAACEQLLRLQGRTHRLITAVAVLDVARDRVEVDVDIHTLQMHPWSAEQIAVYVQTDDPIHCAGSYRLEGRGIALFRQIQADKETADSTAVVGLPLMKLIGLLRTLGFETLTA